MLTRQRTDAVDDPILSALLRRIAMFSISDREALLALFMAETGLKPSEIELVQEQTPTGWRWYYRKRS